MGETIPQLTVFVASPSDVGDERDALEEVIRELNQTLPTTLGIRLELVRWETHTLPELGSDPQAVVNKQIEDNYDIFIGILWARFGTPTPQADSGTLEEFERAYQRYQQNSDNIRIMLYFKEADVPYAQIDPDQFASVRKFRERVSKEGIYQTFKTLDDLKRLLRIHLTRQAHGWGRTWGTERKPRSPELTPKTASGEQRGGDSEDGEEGILDLIELADDSSVKLGRVAGRMTEGMELLMENMRGSTREVKSLRKGGAQIDPRAAKRVVNKAAKHLEEFAQEMRNEVSSFSSEFSNFARAITGAVAHAGDLGEVDKKAMASARKNSQELADVLRTSRTQLKGLRTEVNNLPKLTGTLIRAKRRTVGTLDELDDEFYKAIKLMDEVDDTFGDICDAS